MLDHNGGYVLSALGITILVLGGYAAYLWSRLSGLSRREATHSARNVSAAPPRPITAQAPSSASEPTLNAP